MVTLEIDKKELDDDYLIRWGWDECADSPRDLYDNVGHLYTWTRDCDSPDENAYESPQVFLARELYELFTQEELERAIREGRFNNLRFNTDSGEERLEGLYKNHLTGKTDWDTVNEYEEWKDLEVLVDVIAQCGAASALLRQKGVLMNVYRLEHSGVVYSTSPFNDPWDSGQVGFIWARHDELENLGYENDAVVEKVFAEEVALYSAWADGQTYWARLEKDGDCIDSCDGIIGDEELDDVFKAMEDKAKQHAADNAAKEAKELDVAALRQALKEVQTALQNAMRLLESE